MTEQLSLFQQVEHVQIKIGDEVTVNWNDIDLPYIKKNFPQYLTTGIVKREKFGSYDVCFPDTTAYLIDGAMLVKMN